MIDALLKYKAENADLLSGFDMVQEEDISPPLTEFVKQI